MWLLFEVVVVCGGLHICIVGFEGRDGKVSGLVGWFVSRLLGDVLHVLNFVDHT